MGDVREFDTGATRDTDEGKLDYDGFLSPQVLARYAAYMHHNRKQSDGKLRSADNWQKGMPRGEYMKSMWRHFMDVWSMHRAGDKEQIETALCALMFNVMGYLHEELRQPCIGTFVGAVETCGDCAKFGERTSRCLDDGADVQPTDSASQCFSFVGRRK
jgi:hypothetical protein